MKPYFIVGAIVVIFVVYWIIMAIISSKLKKKKQAAIGQRLTELTPAQRQGLAYGAILSNHRMETNVFDLNEKINVYEYQQGLRTQWGISDQASAVERMTELGNLVASSDLNTRLDAAAIKKVQRKMKKYPAASADWVDTYAWDVCRLAALAKWSYQLGYIDEGTLDYFLARACEIVHHRGTNWDEYTYSFLVGRTMAGFDLDDIYIEALQLLDAQAKRKKSSPYSEVGFK